MAIEKTQGQKVHKSKNLQQYPTRGAPEAMAAQTKKNEPIRM